MDHFWPGVKMMGWELDPKIYPVARAHMGLQQLEDSGALVPFHFGHALLSGLYCNCCVTFACCGQSTNQPCLKVRITQGSSCLLACLAGVAFKQSQPTARA